MINTEERKIPESFNWEQGDTKELEEAAVKLMSGTGYSMVFAKMLAARGITSVAEAEKFLNPSERDMHDPYLMKGMHEAASRIAEAVKNKEKITIYGDYDVDGITATSILFLFFKEAAPGCEIGYHLPDRMSEG